MKAEDIEKLTPGSRVRIEGVEYVRMADAYYDHIEGFLFDPKTGWWGHWSRLAKQQDEVTIPEELQ